MNINHSLKPICFLLLQILFFTCCNGQVKTKSLQNNNNAQKRHNIGKSKISRTQGSDEYQNISCGLEDKNGNLWFGTSDEGVYRYDGKLFTQFTIQHGLNSNTVRSIVEDKKGNIWIGTSKGLCCYNGKSIEQIPILLKAYLQPNFATNSNQFLANDVFSILQDKKGMLWLGTRDGLICYDGNKASYFMDMYTITNDSNLTLKSVQCIFEDKKGTIWFGSGPMAFEGLCLYDGKSLKKFKPQDEGWIRKITEDSNGTLLFDTRHIGLITYDGTIFLDYAKPKNLRKELLQTILVDSKGTIWYGSDYVNDNDITTGGLWMFDGKAFTEFTKKDGLSNTAVTCILEDRHGTIWIGTRTNGLYRYDEKKFTSFSE